MNKKTTFSDEELTAYLDDELPPQRSEQLKDALTSDSELAKRLDSLDFDRESLVDSFSTLLNHSPSAPLLTPQKSTLRSKFGVAAVVVFLCFSAGLSGHYISTYRNGFNQWQEYVAAYQALYIHRTLSNIDSDEPQQKTELNRVSEALGKNIKLKTLGLIPQLSFKRAQILGYEGRVLVQLAFLSSVDTPVALCIMRSDKQKNKALQLTEMEGMQAASWNSGGYDYLLIGGRDKALIREAARTFSLHF